MQTVTCTMVPAYKYGLHYECQYFVFINIFYFCAFICSYLCLNVLCVLDHSAEAFYEVCEPAGWLGEITF